MLLCALQNVWYFSLCYCSLVGGGPIGLKYVGVIKSVLVFSQQLRISFVFLKFVSMEQETLRRYAAFYESNLCLIAVFNMYCDV